MNSITKMSGRSQIALMGIGGKMSMMVRSGQVKQ